MRRYFFLLVVLFCIAANLVFANADEKKLIPKVTSEVAKGEFYIGSNIGQTIRVTDSKGYEVLFPEVPEELGNFIFVKGHPLQPKRKNLQKQSYEYVFKTYTAGTHVLPAIKVKYRKQGETDWQIIQSPPIRINIKSLLTGNDLDIKDIKDLALAKTNYLIVIILFILCVCVALLLIWYRKRKSLLASKPVIIKSANEIAYDELKELKRKDLVKKGLIKEYYVELSGIVRRYLENRFGFRASEMTTEEFMILAQGSPNLTDEHKALLRKFLSHCDMVKFAKYGPTPIEILDSFKLAEEFVDKTRIVVEKNRDSDHFFCKENDEKNGRCPYKKEKECV